MLYTEIAWREIVLESYYIQATPKMLAIIVLINGIITYDPCIFVKWQMKITFFQL